MGLLEGKRAAIFGVANDHSIAWAIARAFRDEGAEVALTYPNEAIEKRVRPLAASIGAAAVLECDVTRDDQIDAAFAAIDGLWNGLDVLVHAVAFAPREELKGRFVDTSRAGFATALDVSAYSLIALARRAAPLLQARGGSILTLTYIGSRVAMPNYNVMGVAKAALESAVRYLAFDLGPAGIRVNAISAGPIRTLSAAGIGGFRDMLRHHADRAPLRRNVTADEVARTALFLAGDLGSAITGEVVTADAGYGIVGM
jgi:enoyl-[acyl-carrier protein] reductase I